MINLFTLHILVYSCRASIQAPGLSPSVRAFLSWTLIPGFIMLPVIVFNHLGLTYIWRTVISFPRDHPFTLKDGILYLYLQNQVFVRHKVLSGYYFCPCQKQKKNF